MTDVGAWPVRAVGVLALSWLLVLPLGHLFVFPVAGATATLTDLALLVVVLGSLLALLGGLGSPEPGVGLDAVRGHPRTALLLLLGFAVWVAASTLWSFHPEYAGAKGAGLGLLVAGAWIVATARVTPGGLVDAWLAGAGVALVVTLGVGALGPDALRARVLYGGGLVEGLPFQRVRGPFLHPNLLGDYLAVTALLLWARWPVWRASGRRSATGAVALASLLTVGLALSVSSGWLTLAAGGLALVVAAPGWRPATRAVVGLAGVGLAVPTAVGLARPIEIPLGPLVIRSGGIRPEIWTDAAEAVLTSPLLGVGAAPYLSETADPFSPGGTVVWDAHSTYLSVLGQFGLVGGALFFGGLAFTVVAVFRAGRASAAPGSMSGPAADQAYAGAETSVAPAQTTGPVAEQGVAAAVDRAMRYRLAVAVLAALAGLLVHWTSIAGEESRHVWALVGIGLAVALAPMETEPVSPGEGRG